MENFTSVEEVPTANCPELFAQFLNNSDQEVMPLSFMRNLPSSNLGRGNRKYTEEASAVVLFSASRQMSEQYLKLRLDCVVSRPFCFHIHYHHISLCCLVCLHQRVLYLRKWRLCCRHTRRALPQGSNRLLSACLLLRLQRSVKTNKPKAQSSCLSDYLGSFLLLSSSFCLTYSNVKPGETHVNPCDVMNCLVLLSFSFCIFAKYAFT